MCKKNIFVLQSQCVKMWCFQCKLMKITHFYTWTLKRQQKFTQIYGLAVCQGKRASILNTLKIVANLRFCSRKDIHSDLDDHYIMIQCHWAIYTRTLETLIKGHFTSLQIKIIGETRQSICHFQGLISQDFFQEYIIS